MAEHGIIGEDFGIDLPQTQVAEQDLIEERRMAKFSKSREFKALKERMEQRIEFYQKQLPDGRSVVDVDTAERANMWVIANCVIGEFNAVIAAYEDASAAVKEADIA